MDKKTLFRSWGFDTYPFSSWSAEHEQDPEKYFLEPPYFDEVVGDPTRPVSSVVYGRRGGGKSTLHNMVALRLRGLTQNRPLVVEYADFSHWDAEAIRRLSLDQHIDRIIGGAVAELVREGERNDSAIRCLSRENRLLLQWFVLSFLPAPDYQEVECRLVALYDRLDHPSKVRQLGPRTLRRLLSAMRRKRAEMERLVANQNALVQAVIGLLLMLCPRVPGPADVRNATPMALLSRFVGLVRAAGFASLYVLIDRVDEAPGVGGRNDLAARLIEPLAASLQYLDSDGIATKMFLPAQAADHLAGKIRTDRLHPARTISWTVQGLAELLRRRLLAASGGKIEILQHCFETDAWECFSSDAFLYAGLSPRDLLRIIDHIVSEHCEMADSQSPITRTAVETGIRQFYSIRILESDGEEYDQRLTSAQLNEH